MAGVEPPESMEGADLSPLLDGDERPAREHSIGGYSDSFYIRTDNWALHGLNRPGGFRLYDVQADPDERSNVAAGHPAWCATCTAVWSRPSAAASRSTTRSERASHSLGSPGSG